MRGCLLKANNKGLKPSSYFAERRSEKGSFKGIHLQDQVTFKVPLLPGNYMHCNMT